MTKSILLVGVGGQGTILASKILSSGLLKSGFDVKMSEIHGMSQRGGSVSTHVRYGDKVHSPVIERGGADILVSFEQMEALRWLEYVKPKGKAIVNSLVLNPMSVLIGQAVYSDKILNEISKTIETTVLDAHNEALKLGNPRTLNILLLGATVKLMELTNIDWDEIIAKNVRPAFAEVNQKAFERGMELV